jgi:endonuclease YncB( thermonuclease family)
MEFALSSALAAVAVAAWLQWSSAERTAATVAASNPLGDIVGRASVKDGDTIEIHGESIRILDVDAPESGQLCTKPGGEDWRCGSSSCSACQTRLLDNRARLANSAPLILISTRTASIHPP